MDFQGATICQRPFQPGEKLRVILEANLFSLVNLENEYYTMRGKVYGTGAAC